MGHVLVAAGLQALVRPGRGPLLRNGRGPLPLVRARSRRGRSRSRARRRRRCPLGAGDSRRAAVGMLWVTGMAILADGPRAASTSDGVRAREPTWSAWQKSRGGGGGGARRRGPPTATVIAAADAGSAVGCGCARRRPRSGPENYSAPSATSNGAESGGRAGSSGRAATAAATPASESDRTARRMSRIEGDDGSRSTGVARGHGNRMPVWSVVEEAADPSGGQLALERPRRVRYRSRRQFGTPLSNIGL